MTIINFTRVEDQTHGYHFLWNSHLSTPSQTDIDFEGLLQLEISRLKKLLSQYE